MRTRNLTLGLLGAVLAAMPSIAQQLVNLPTRDARVHANYGKLPLTFEANQGQTDLQARFVSRGRGYTAFLTAGGMVLSLRPSTAAAVPSSMKSASAGSTTVEFGLVGAATNSQVVGEDPQPGKVNYFFGNDPAQWRTNVPTYSRVRYKNIYPGIDLVYYGNQRRLEYDFELQSGSDPRKIQFEITGARAIKLDSQGNLILSVDGGELHFQCPIVYQQVNGQRVPVSGTYLVTDSTHIAFNVAHYDPSQPLVIDPVLVYSTYLGGSGTDQPIGIAVDSTGSIYLAGYTNSIDFPLATLGSLPKNTNHVFVAKLDAAGANLIYADYIGGNNQDYAAALALDSANNVYVTGSTTSSNFPTVKAYQAQQPGPYTGFLTEVSASGSSLLYSSYLGGSTFDQPASVAIDRLGHVHVAGFTMSTNFPVANAYQSSATANQGGLYGNYGFLTKFSTDGSSLVYSTFLAGNSNVVQDCGSPCWPTPYNTINALALDANGNAYVAGTTNTYNFPVTSGAYLTSNTTQQDPNIGFVSKFSTSGGLDYSTYFYGSSGNPISISGIAVDGTSSAYVTGEAESDGTFPITTTGICDPGVYGFGCSYAFVTKFDPAGATLLYSTFLGPNNYAFPQAIALDSAGDAYLLAAAYSASFQTVNAIEAYGANEDLLLVELDPSATTQLYSTFLGGSGNDAPAGMAVDAAQNVYVAGSTDSTDLPITQGAFQGQLGGNTDAFVMKIGAVAAPAVAFSPNALQFSPGSVGSTSQPQSVEVRNMGSSPLTISSISTTGDYAETNTCGSGLPAAGSCTLSVTFTPTAAGSRIGSVLIADNASGSPHAVSLDGTGSGAGVTLTPAALSFASTPLGTSTTAQTLTLANPGTTSLSIGSFQVTGDYSQTNNCPASLAVGSSCNISIVFSPTSSGSRAGTLTIVDNAAGSPQQTVALSGSGADFSLASSPLSATVKAGSTATYNLTVAPVGGAFTNSVKITCSGPPNLSTCSVSPASVAPGSSSTPVTITVTTTSSSAQVMPLTPARQQPIYAVWIQLQGLGVFGLLAAGATRPKSKRGKKLSALIVLALLISALLFMSACAGGTGIGSHGGGTTPGTYTLTVTGASGTLQHTQSLTLIVQ